MARQLLPGLKALKPLKALALPGAKAAATGAVGANRRKKPRLSIGEINRRGMEAIEAKRPDVAERLKKGKPWWRTAVELPLDFLDLPRNIVANAIAGLTGMDTSKLARGTFGERKVFARDIMKHLGIDPGGVGGAVLGFVGDVALDPLTYIFLGARGVVRIARGAPKIIKPGYKLVRQAAKGMARGAAREIPEKVALAAGRRPERLAGIGQRMVRGLMEREGITAAEAVKRVAKRMAGRKAGALGRVIGRKAVPLTGLRKGGEPTFRAAREFFKEFGETGRTIARLPFAKRGLELRFGKRARLFREFAEPGEAARYLTQLGRRARAGRAAGAALSAAAKARGERIGKAAELRELAERYGLKVKDLAPEARLPTGETVAAAKALAYAKGAPSKARIARLAERMRTAEARRMGMLTAKEAPESIKQAGKALTRMLRQKELGILTQMGPGTSAAKAAAITELQPTVRRAAAGLARKGYGKESDIRQLIGHVLDVGGPEGLARLHPSDRAVLDWGRRFAGISGEPELRAVMGAYGSKMAQFADEAARGGFGFPAIEGYFARQPTRKAKPFIRAFEERWGGAAGRAEALRRTRGQPYAFARTELVEITDEAGTVLKNAIGGPLTELTSNLTPARLAQLARRGRFPGKKTWPISAYHMNQLAQEGRLAGKLGPQFRGPIFEMDPAISIGTRAAQHERASAVKRLYDMAQEHQVIVRPGMKKAVYMEGMGQPARLAAGHPLRKMLPKGIYPSKGLEVAYPKPVAEILDRFAESFQPGEQMNRLLRASDSFLLWWKRWALFHPAYVARNAFQNMLGTVMAGGNPLEQVRLAGTREVGRLYHAIGRFRPEMARGTLRLAGRNVPLSELARHGIDQNLVGAVRSVAEFQHPFLAGGDVFAAAGRRITKGWRRVRGAVQGFNAQMEARMRLGTWLHFLDKGLDYNEAMRRTLLAMPDMADIPRWMRLVGVRVFPWARWTYANGSVQLLHYLPNAPAWMAASPKVKRMLEQALVPGGAVPEELRPDWMREAGGFQVSGDEEEGLVFLLRSWLPFEEIQQLIVSPLAPGEGARYAMGQMRPELKFIAEAATGRDIFRRRPAEVPMTPELIKRLPGAVVGRSGTILDSVLSIRPLREYARRVPEQVGVGRRVTRAILGGAIQPVSAKRGLAARDVQTRARMADLRRKMIRAKENRDFVELRALLRQFMHMQMERRRLGLPVYKATERAFAEAGI